MDLPLVATGSRYALRQTTRRRLESPAEPPAKKQFRLDFDAQLRAISTGAHEPGYAEKLSELAKNLAEHLEPRERERERAMLLAYAQKLSRGDTSVLVKLTIAMRLGEADAAYELGNYFSRADARYSGGSQETAVLAWRHAGRSDHPPAIRKLGTAYLHGQGLREAEPSNGTALLHRAYALGETGALTDLGSWKIAHASSPAELQEGRALLDEAQADGDAQAAHVIAELERSGRLGHRDEESAAELEAILSSHAGAGSSSVGAQAAEIADAYAAEALITGSDGHIDFRHARSLLEPLAAAGYERARERLDAMPQHIAATRIEGLRRLKPDTAGYVDAHEAQVLLRAAAAAGDDEAKNALAALEARIYARESEELQMLISPPPHETGDLFGPLDAS